MPGHLRERYMTVETPETTAHAEVVFVDHTHEAVARVEIYVRVRAEFSLPPLVSHLVGDRLRLTFGSVPPPARVDALTDAELAFIVHRLGRLEGALGSNLAAVGESALRYDPIRKVPAITAGLFIAPKEEPPAVVSLLRALGIVGEHPPHSVRAAVATLAAIRPDSGMGDDEASLVRALLDAAIAERAAGRPTAAASSLRNAWALRAGDAETGQHLLDLANEAGVELPEGVEAGLEPLAAGNARLLAALARGAERTGNAAKAQERARALTVLAPEEPLGWRILAAAAQDAPASEGFRVAMLGLARAGEERALRWIWATLGPEAAGPLLDEWPHHWTPVSASIRIRWLGHQERLRDLLQFYFGTSRTVRPLDADALDVVVASAARIPGRLQALRERMKLLLQEGVEAPLVRAYVAACQLDQVPEAIVEADRMWPGEVPSAPLARAFLVLDRFDEAVRHAEVAGLHDVRLQALAKQALLRGERAPAVALRDAVRRLGAASHVVAELLADLRRVSPDSAITAQMQRLIEEST
jgi:hypothetical protein